MTRDAANAGITRSKSMGILSTGNESPSANAHARDVQQKNLRVVARNLARKLLLHDENKSLREALQSELTSPTHVRVIDQISFTLGVLNMCFTVFILTKFPHMFWLWYTIWAVPLIIWRYVTYSRKKYQYFLLDYCYSVNALCFVHLFVAPNNTTVFSPAFMSACGPLAWAIVAWRNSLVFHDLERVTSLFIHIMPPLLMFCQRWYYPSAAAGNPGLIPPYLRCYEPASHEDVASMQHTCSRGYWAAMLYPLAFYVVWQVVYFLKTEVLDRHKFEADPEILTSLRWLARDDRGLLHQIARSACASIGVMQRGEKFCPEQFKTKLVFMTAQFIYTLLTLLPTKLMYDSKYVNLAFIVLWGANATWNGSSYYFEVFAERYANELRKALEVTNAKTEAMIASGACDSVMQPLLSTQLVVDATLSPTFNLPSDSSASTASFREGSTTPLSQSDTSSVMSDMNRNVGPSVMASVLGFDFGALADGVAVSSPVSAAAHEAVKANQRRRSLSQHAIPSSHLNGLNAINGDSDVMGSGVRPQPGGKLRFRHASLRQA